MLTLDPIDSRYRLILRDDWFDPFGIKLDKNTRSHAASDYPPEYSKFPGLPIRCESQISFGMLEAYSSPSWGRG